MKQCYYYCKLWVSLDVSHIYWYSNVISYFSWERSIFTKLECDMDMELDSYKSLTSTLRFVQMQTYLLQMSTCAAEYKTNRMRIATVATYQYFSATLSHSYVQVCVVCDINECPLRLVS